MEDVWVEKYRPKNLDEVVGQKEIVERLKSYVKAKSMPHLLFAGPAGTGKTTCAIALARELFGDNWRSSFHELNASDERGIGIVRTKIKEYARTAAPNDVGFKIIFLDEADALTPDAQAALRRTMEMYSRTCRFILSCNYSSKIIEPIQSRCAVFRFTPLKAEDIKKRLRYIAENEGKEITDDALDAIVYISSGDMRKAINILQMSAAISDTIDEGTVYKATGIAKREDVEEVVKKALGGDFISARNKLNKLLVELGLSGEDVIKQIHRVIYDLPIDDRLKVELLDRTGEIEFRMVEGANERIQLDALLAYFTLAGRRENL
ncbi:DNA polymerase III, gamma/tau subunit [Aciduliprofundum sp. MAR08-339]|uniref:replication factor C small subunit n=1 Tax=Aciduliprofundum sp. (strain MAR08-339) TaxID=673860 RepID=UPI0002A4BD97|nr:DNA polymerase III, gamma/tau subunit [Aciduliprofundum sp. MAR08-339]